MAGSGAAPTIESVSSGGLSLRVLLWPDDAGRWRSAWQMPGDTTWHGVNLACLERETAIEEAAEAARRYLASPRAARARERQAGSSAGPGGEAPEPLRSDSDLLRQMADDLAHGVSPPPERLNKVFDKALRMAFRRSPRGG